MKRHVAQLLVWTVAFAAFLQWWQISYRYNLFANEYNHEVGMNHIGDEDFGLLYTANIALIIVGLTSVVLRRVEGRRAVWFAVVPLIANALAFASWYLMHRTGVLVGYQEFIGNAMNR